MDTSVWRKHKDYYKGKFDYHDLPSKESLIINQAFHHFSPTNLNKLLNFLEGLVSGESTRRCETDQMRDGASENVGYNTTWCVVKTQN